MYIYELNPPIIQTAQGMAHVVDRHTHSGIARTYDVGQVIGFDIATGTLTALVTVITDASGNLTTAFPGNP